MKMVINCNKLRASSHPKPSVFQHLISTTRFLPPPGNLSMYDSKRANLSAARKQRIKLPNSDSGCRFNEFLSESSGIEAVLNTRALQSFQPLDVNTYRCVLPKLQLLNFEAAPVLDLRVIPTDESCTVELISCKFPVGHGNWRECGEENTNEGCGGVVGAPPPLIRSVEFELQFKGSEVVERQNEHFTAFMTNSMSWDINGPEPFLEVDVRLDLTLEIYTLPFTLLPTSAVERPGNLMMQALVDRLVPLLLEQLMRDYDKWASQRKNAP